MLVVLWIGINYRHSLNLGLHITLDGQPPISGDSFERKVSVPRPTHPIDGLREIVSMIDDGEIDIQEREGRHFQARHDAMLPPADV